MTNIINLDELQPQATFVFKDKEYELKPMTSKLFLEWNALRRESERIRRHSEIIEKKIKAEAESLTEEQQASFDGQLAVLQEETMGVQVGMITLLLDGMTDEVAEDLSDIQRNVVMAEMTKMMRKSMKDLKADTEEVGESPTP